MAAEANANDKAVWTEDVMRFGDTDALGHINNAVFAVFCESGRVHLFRRWLDPHLPSGAFFVIARLAIDFRAELRYPGTVRTATRMARVGRSSLTLAQDLFSDGVHAATAESVCVLMDGATRRSTPFPNAMRGAAEALLTAPAPSA